MERFKFIELETIDAKVELDNIVYFKNEKKLNLYFKTDKIIPMPKLIESESKLKLKFKHLSRVSLKPRYNLASGVESLLIEYVENIKYKITEVCPSTSYLNEDALSLDFNQAEHCLNIYVKDKFVLKRLTSKNLEYSIGAMIQEELGLMYKVNIISSNTELDMKLYNQAKEEDTNYIISNLDKVTRVASTSKEKAEKKPADKSAYIKKSKNAKDVNEEILPIKALKGNEYAISVVGDVFSMEKRELKNGKNLFTFAVTDYTGSIFCKVFSKDDEISIKVGDYVKISGDVNYDAFAKEIVIMTKDIEPKAKKIRKDINTQKRVELHAHTNMSAMDAIPGVKALIKKAKEFGHKAIAITDHGVVQAFPEAMEVGQNEGVKILYGVEGYLVNDMSKIVSIDTEGNFEDEYVVFDIETTGFSNTSDEITEIGAVKIRNKEIIDSFGELINPHMPIPLKVQELTGITNDLIKDKPSIDEVLPKFLEFVGGSILVAHNSDFDMGFIRAKAKRLNLAFENKDIDTLKLARILLPNLKRHKLNLITNHLGISLENHHRAVDDAKATALVFIKFMEMLIDKDINNFEMVNDKLGKLDYKSIPSNHITIIAKDYTGLKNLYKLISASHIDYFYKNPRIPKSLLIKHREGLLIGSACEAGELYQAVLRRKSDDEIDEIANFYDYIEVMPTSNNNFMIKKNSVKDEIELQTINKTIIDIAIRNNKIPVATSDVHFINPEDEAYRTVLKHSLGFKDANESTPLYFKTTQEMLDDFSYLEPRLANEIVIENTNKIADMIEDILPVPDGTYPPRIEGSDEELRQMCFEKARNIYGDNLPEIVEKRLERELGSIISNGYAVMYIIAQKLVTKSMQDGYLVGSRGSVGSSFAATMSDITEVNPLPPHYVCSNCKYSYFITDGSYGSGADLPDKLCPDCSTNLTKDGHDIPFEVFLGFEGDKEPDIDLNFAGEYQPNAHKYTEELFGKGYVFRAGTIGTIAEKTAYGFAKKYIEENEIEANGAEVERLKSGCTGIKRTSGQHPGGVMVVPDYKEIFDFSPIQYPANDSSSGVITTHFDYHSISGRILKLDILGHDVPSIIKMLEDLTGTNATQIPLDDKDTMSLFTSTQKLGCDLSAINCTVGSLGIPEFGTKFVRQMLIDTQPTTFAELVRISGLSHGTDVWINNAQELVRNKVAELKDVISTRDDIMNYLILMGLKPKTAFKIMENVRKGKGLTDEHIQDMKEKNVPSWYIDSCNKIKYMFPKAHAAAYVMMSFRIAYYKVHHKEAFYATYFTTKAEDFDIELISKGKDAVLEKLKELEALGNKATAKEKNIATVLEVAYEMFSRGVKLDRLDLYKSHAKVFKLSSDKALIPPLISMQGLGETVAINIANESSREFMSIEDFRQRTKATKTVIETLIGYGCLNSLPETNQLSLL